MCGGYATKHSFSSDVVLPDEACLKSRVSTRFVLKGIHTLETLEEI